MLIGMFDSPFVRRVAISMKLLEIPFEHANWSVGADYARIRAHSPLGRVPVLVLDDGEALTESAAILDHLDDRVRPRRALLPATGAARRSALNLMSLAIGAVEKGRDVVYERFVRPADKRHEPWAARCREQMHGALGLLETKCPAGGREAWLLGERFSQADITVACGLTFLGDSGVLSRDVDRYPALMALVARCEALPEFVATRSQWFAPAV